ncbi:MAG: MurR/RpiR family transcriptional regulator [Alphaproteobacteria bacterium]|nr:MurR/RpiR family transcriptional regulator [Alphaproteobacteria bacterium]
MRQNEASAPAPSPSLAERIARHVVGMGPAEQRVVRYFEAHREEVLIASAATLAERASTSDATVVRAVRTLGFSGLEELRRALADEIRISLSPADRLTRTLGEVGSDLATAYETTLDIHRRSLEALSRAIPPALFERAVTGIIEANRVALFGLGPSSAIAAYAAMQLNRFGLAAITLNHTGMLFADDLSQLRDGDLVIMLAYGRVYPELAALLDAIEQRRLRAFLITDTLAATLRRRVELVLAVPRGRADSVSMHTATLGFIEALLVGIAVKRPEATTAALRTLNEARETLAGKDMKLQTRSAMPIRERARPRR